MRAEYIDSSLHHTVIETDMLARMLCLVHPDIDQTHYMCLCERRTQLAATAHPGDTAIQVLEAVNWPIGAKILIATTDMESSKTSHSETATVAWLSEDNKGVGLHDIRVCPNYFSSGLPTNCTHKNELSFVHLGENKTFAGKEVHFRAEVGLLTRNIVIEGDYDETLCPFSYEASDSVQMKVAEDGTLNVRFWSEKLCLPA
jgi:hypothetical protein